MTSSIQIHTPGRICLFGDHQDYLGLPVIACAFNKGITLVAQPIEESVIEIDMPNTQERRTIDLLQHFEPQSSRDYFISALHVVEAYGCTPNQGYKVEINGNLPINAGVSSSSALLVGWIHFLLNAYGCNQPMSPALIGALAYQAEVEFFNEPGGKMDQFTCSLGGMVYLETGTDFSATTLDVSLSGMVLGNSGIEKQTLQVLSEARSKTEKAIAMVQKEHSEVILKEIQLQEMDRYLAHLPKSYQSYFKAAITNHSITQKALIALQQQPMDMNYLGQLMTQHHNILRNVLGLTVPKIDQMIEASLHAGAYGAKIIGSGGGGCIVALAAPEDEQAVALAMKQAGAIEAYPITVAKGTRIL